MMNRLVGIAAAGVVLLAALPYARTSGLQPTIANCSATFAKYPEDVRARRAAILVGMIGNAVYRDIKSPVERAAFLAELRADRERAMDLWTSGLLEPCYAALGDQMEEIGPALLDAAAEYSSIMPDRLTAESGSGVQFRLRK